MQVDGHSVRGLLCVARRGSLGRGVKGRSRLMENSIIMSGAWNAQVYTVVSSSRCTFKAYSLLCESYTPTKIMK